MDIIEGMTIEEYQLGMKHNNDNNDYTATMMMMIVHGWQRTQQPVVEALD